jgi:hypothetical protein
MRISSVSFDSLKWVAGLASAYTIVSFLWSGFGFLSPTTPVHLHEYSLGALAQEVGGHVLFGVAAALVTLNVPLILLAGAESILIDVDHLLPALNSPVEGRLAHSVAFAVVSAVLLSYLARKNGRLNRGVLLVTLAAAAAHLSYDVFAGNGLFPLLSPFTLSDFNFPAWTWVPLEAIALLLCVMLRLNQSSRGRT